MSEILSRGSYSKINIHTSLITMMTFLLVDWHGHNRPNMPRSSARYMFILMLFPFERGQSLESLLCRD